MESNNYPGSYYQPLFDLLNQEHGITPLESEMTDIIVVVEKMRDAQPGAVWVKAIWGMIPDGIHSMKLVSRDNVVMRGTGLVKNNAITVITFLNKSTMGEKELPEDYKGVYWLDESGAAAAPQWTPASTKPEHNVGVLVFIPGEDNHITSGMWDISNQWVLLDEYRTPEEEVTHWMPLPAFPEGHERDVISDEWVSTLKAIAKEELSKKNESAAGREEAVEFAEWLNSNFVSIENKEGEAVYVEYSPQEYDKKQQFKIGALYELFKQQKEK